MMHEEVQDKNLSCEACSKEFTYSKVEQEFDRDHGVEAQRLCPTCRQEETLEKSEIKGEGASGANGGFNS
jgi:hypothetical protein